MAVHMDVIIQQRSAGGRGGERRGEKCEGERERSCPALRDLNLRWCAPPSPSCILFTLSACCMHHLMKGVCVFLLLLAYVTADKVSLSPLGPISSLFSPRLPLHSILHSPTCPPLIEPLYIIIFFFVLILYSHNSSI